MKKNVLQIWGALPIPDWLRWMLVYSSIQKFPVGVAAFILDSEGRVLLFRHTYRSKFPWGLPSGWLKPGEAPDSAIVREIAEESSLKVEAKQVVFCHSAQEARRLDIVYHCQIAAGEFRPSEEVDAMAWFQLDELPPMLFAQYDIIFEIHAKMNED